MHIIEEGVGVEKTMYQSLVVTGLLCVCAQTLRLAQVASKLSYMLFNVLKDYKYQSFRQYSKITEPLGVSPRLASEVDTKALADRHGTLDLMSSFALTAGYAKSTSYTHIRSSSPRINSISLFNSNQLKLVMASPCLNLEQ